MYAYILQEEEEKINKSTNEKKNIWLFLLFENLHTKPGNITFYH